MSGEAGLNQPFFYKNTAITLIVLVCGSISYDSMSPLVILQSSLTTQQHVDTILWLNVLPFMAQNTENSLQHDNARPNTPRISLDYLHAVNTCPWLVKSPDLSPL
ncbi:transcription initiation factor TFIID subunit 5 [Trichonephila clavipes]|nr:transcription initiation factor TFIID subunit 5 [Trichonephila clavipes]